MAGGAATQRMGTEAVSDHETLWQIVDDEALHDWLAELPALKADERPEPYEYEDLGRDDRR